ncbi:pentapeptide repeat-containing protein [Chitinophaga sp. Hz27]|uniref:pentapeptide repeat-containing protein n=1 Tax=Chitinophaga sp. Hz27 TaxID=3347169 RepID=UPI0035DC808E
MKNQIVHLFTHPRNLYVTIFLLMNICMHGMAQTRYTCPSCDLRGHDFSGQDLTNANFSFAKLDNANFSNCTLNGAMFDNASMQQTIFRNAKINASNISPANFSKGNLSYADFTGASLQRAVFTFANLNGTIFNKSDLREAKFGTSLLLRGDKSSTPPSFQDTRLPYELKRFMKNDDLSKISFLPPITPKIKQQKSGRKSASDTVYVALRGADNNGCGTAGNPCKSISYAVSIAPANGIVGLASDSFVVDEFVDVEKNVEIVGGLDADYQWEATIYQTSITAGIMGVPIFIISQQNTNVTLSNLMLNGVEGGTAVANVVLLAYNGTTITFNDVNIYAGSPYNARDGFTGAGPGCCVMCHGAYYANCGPGGTASSNVKGTCCTLPFGWSGISGGAGGSGTNDPCYELCPGAPGFQGGGSFGVMLDNATLNIDTTSIITAAAGSNGGKGGGGLVSAGGGAGGNGGPSGCIGLKGNATVNGQYGFYLGTAGSGGKGGSSSYNSTKGCSGQNGQDGFPGIVGQTIQF